MSGLAREDFAVRPDRAEHSDRTEGDRRSDFLAEHRSLELAVRHVDHHAFAETDGIEVAAIFAKRNLREGSGLHIIHERLGDAPMRLQPQVFNAGDAVGNVRGSAPLL